MNMAVISSSDLSMHVHRCVYLQTHTCLYATHCDREREGEEEEKEEEEECGKRRERRRELQQRN